MTEILYDESTFPEYVEKVRREMRQAIETFLGGVVAYFVAVAVVVFLLFPEAPSEDKLRGALLLLGIPLFFGFLSGVTYWINRRNPRRVTDEAILQSVFRLPLQDIREIVWYGPPKGAKAVLDPQKYLMKTWRIRGDDLLRPEEFLQALEGRVPITRKEGPPD